jgi:hypothetical protein
MDSKLSPMISTLSPKINYTIIHTLTSFPRVFYFHSGFPLNFHVHFSLLIQGNSLSKPKRQSLLVLLHNLKMARLRGRNMQL